MARQDKTFWYEQPYAHVMAGELARDGKACKLCTNNPLAEYRKMLANANVLPIRPIRGRKQR